MKISFNELYKRCVYSSIAHAVYTFREPFFAFEQSWDNKNFSFYINSTRGTISFDEGKQIVSAAARYESSNRIQLYPAKNAVDLFKGAPQDVVALAESEALQYLIDDVNGIQCPVATVAMWNKGNEITLSDSEDIFVEHGGDFILKLCNLNFNLVDHWQQEYELTSIESDLINNIFTSFMSNQQIVLNKESKKMLKKSKGKKQGLESLGEIGIKLKI